MPTLRRFRVVPALPPALEPLRQLAYNLWWSFNLDARELFERIDPELWSEVGGNPVALLARVPQSRLDDLSHDDAFHAAVDGVMRSFQRYMTREGWTRGAHAELAAGRIGYFSMEFGIHECLPVYSGGLGVLAGDHLKTASDLGLPLVGVGVAYAKGYFRQALNDDGWQAERYPGNDWHALPVTPVLDQGGARLLVSVPFPGRQVLAQAFRVDVGRVPLFLLDANLEENSLEDREITNTLYGGDQDHRIRQEILLGVGGIRLLYAVGLPPDVCHINEGHSAFMSIERIRRVMAEHGAPFAVAREAAAAGNIFTTHTPVPAGNDAFPPPLVAPYLEAVSEGTGLSRAELLGLGRVDPAEETDFSMPALAIRTSEHFNGVSLLHGREARRMWQELWPGLPVHEVPIGSITNGVHAPTWVARELADLFTQYLGPRWREEPDDAAIWSRVAEIPDAELWHAHERRRARLVARARRRLHDVAERRARVSDLPLADEVLDPHALTIGFARRFATYKRATLLFTDVERLARILGDEERPVQLVFSGKAHPRDGGGKELIRAIVKASRGEAFRRRVVFLEDYDMGVARLLVSGVDVWLNTPRRPLEASGTSGMKAALNGVLNLSVLDGWWCEAWAADNGWAVGRGEEYGESAMGDRIEAEQLYQILEDEVVPLFYERGRDRLPRGWIARMKRSIATIAPAFNTQRMLRDYVRTLYLPALSRHEALRQDRLHGAYALTAWKERVRAAWPRVHVEHIEERGGAEVVVGAEMQVLAVVALGGLRPEDVSVELYHGKLNGGHDLAAGSLAAMRCSGELGEGRFGFEGSIVARESGSHAYAVRVLPRPPGGDDRFGTRLLTWG